MRFSAGFQRHFSTFFRNKKNLLFSPRVLPKYNYFQLFTWFTFGTVVFNYNKILNYQQYASNEELRSKYEAKRRLVFIRNKNNEQDQDLELFIQSLKKAGVDVVEVNSLN